MFKLINLLGVSSVLLFVLHCGNASLYDDALKVHYRVVRNALNEWYPLDGNLDSRIGSASATALSFTGGVNRDGEGGKSVCTNGGGPFQFTNATFGTSPFTVSVWISMNTLPAAGYDLLRRGTQITSYRGFKMDLDNLTALRLIFGSGGATDKIITGPAMLAKTWYYVAFTYDGAAGTFYVGTKSGLTKVGSLVGGYQKDSSSFQLFDAAMDGCVDDLLHYNRALSAQEVEYNFLTLE